MLPQFIANLAEKPCNKKIYLSLACYYKIQKIEAESL